MHIHAQRKWICFRRGCNSEVDLVPSLNHKSYHNFYHKFDHTCGLGVQGSYCGVPGTIHGAQGKLSWRTWHYPRVAIGSTIQGWPLSKGGSGVHYARVATIHGSTIQRWSLSKRTQIPFRSSLSASSFSAVPFPQVSFPQFHFRRWVPFPQVLFREFPFRSSLSTVPFPRVSFPQFQFHRLKLWGMGPLPEGQSKLEGAD